MHGRIRSSRRRRSHRRWKTNLTGLAIERLEARSLLTGSIAAAGETSETRQVNYSQAEADSAFKTITLIARYAEDGGRPIFDDSIGVDASVSDPDVTFVDARVDTVEGTYAVNITTPAERAHFSAMTKQSMALAHDEVLTVNDVSMSLSEGMTQAQVVDRINQFTDQTRVTADITDGRTRLYSDTFGSSSAVRVVSNTANSSDSSGFGTTLHTDNGVDIVGTIGNEASIGVGNILTGTSGHVKDLELKIAAKDSDIAQTVTGEQGSVSY